MLTVVILTPTDMHNLNHTIQPLITRLTLEHFINTNKNPIKFQFKLEEQLKLQLQ